MEDTTGALDLPAEWAEPPTTPVAHMAKRTKVTSPRRAIGRSGSAVPFRRRARPPGRGWGFTARGPRKLGATVMQLVESGRGLRRRKKLLSKYSGSNLRVGVGAAPGPRTEWGSQTPPNRARLAMIRPEWPVAATRPVRPRTAGAGFPGEVTYGPPKSTAFESTTSPFGPIAYGWTVRAWAVRRILRTRNERPTRCPSPPVR